MNWGRAFAIAVAISSLLLVGCSVSPNKEVDGRGRFEVVVLGIAQDGGLPHLGCEKPCCQDARRTGRELYPACIAIHDRETSKLVLIEATPAIEKQVSLLHSTVNVQGRNRKPVDALLITHAHIGHYAGLVLLGREVASTRELPVHITPRFSSFLRQNGPWNQLVELNQIRIETVDPGRTFEPIPGLKVTAVVVPHRDEFSDTVAYKIEGSDRTVLFVPDIDRWQDDRLSALIDGVDVAYIDATFYDGRELPSRNLAEIPHPLVIDTMRRLAKEARESPGRFRFIHLNHTNPLLTDPALKADLESRGFRIARQGERVRF